MTDPVTLKEHIETQIRWVDRHFAAQLSALALAVKEAKDQLDERLRSMNEFRLTLTDQASRLSTKSEVDSLKEEIDRRIKALEINRAFLEGRAIIVSTVVAGLVAALVRFI